MTDTKNTTAKTSAPKAAAKTEPAKAKRTARTIDEQIAELEAKKQARLEKSRAKDQLAYDEAVGKYTRAVESALKHAGTVRDLAAKHGFALPEGITPPSSDDVERAQVAAQAEAESDESDVTPENDGSANS